MLFRSSRGRAYSLIAGYNTASRQEKLEYDIEGLAKHLGNGLVTLGVVAILAILSVYFGMLGIAGIFTGLFLFFVFIRDAKTCVFG